MGVMLEYATKFFLLKFENRTLANLTSIGCLTPHSEDILLLLCFLNLIIKQPFNTIYNMRPMIGMDKISSRMWIRKCSAEVNLFLNIFLTKNLGLRLNRTVYSIEILEKYWF